MHNYFWKYKEINKDDVANISSEFSVSKSIASIMSLKSINNKQKSKDFFYEDITSMHDLSLIHI